jgi:hypothetical protein
LPKPDLIERGRADYVDAVVRDADHAIFGLEAQGFCRKCHHIEADGQDWEVLTFDPAVVSDGAAAPRREMIPSRWFQHAEFSHRKHLSSTKGCAECHDVSQSKATADVLLPSIAQCRTCHGASATNAAGRTGDSCTQCHSYHDPIHSDLMASGGREPPVRELPKQSNRSVGAQGADAPRSPDDDRSTDDGPTP